MAMVDPHNILLDHVVLLVPYRAILEPPGWIVDNFVVGAGSRHADGKTINRLILFKDGTYLELIAFINDDPVKAAGHGWDKDFGVVDIALTTRGAFDHKILQERLRQTGTDISYADPVDGGRTPSDGPDLKWKVTFSQGIERGAVPFWCHDVTPRERRVRGTESNTQHPCGAMGVAGIFVEIGKADCDRAQAALAVIVGKEGNSSNFEMGTPYDIGMIDRPNIRLRKSLLDNKEQLRLRLVLYNPRTPTPPSIEQRIGSGMVSIRFEP